MENCSENSKPILISNGCYSMLFKLQKPLLIAIRVIGGSCKAAIKLLNFFFHNEANVNTIKNKHGRYSIP